jgi:glutamate-1-semialdehyde 2,1-aminomutase
MLQACQQLVVGQFVAVPAGTLSGNPLAMTAGIKTLEILDRPGSYEYLDKITSRLVAGIMAAAKEAGHAICGGHISGEWRDIY